MEEISELQERECDPKHLCDSKIVLCRLCGKKYDNPKLLKCQHSFCRECLITYLTITQDTEEGKCSFNCPTCSELMTISCDGNLPEEQSVDAIDDDIIMTGVLEILTSSDYDQSIGPEDSVDLVQWPVEDLTALTTEWLESAQKTPKCKDHAKDIEFFCKSHGRTLCSSCAILKHKTCSDIVMCSDLKTVFLDKAKLVGETARANSKLAESLRNELSVRCRQLCENRDSVRAQIREAKDEMIRILNEAESELYTELDDICDTRRKQYEERLQCCRTIHQQSQFKEKCMAAVADIQSSEFVAKNVTESETSCDSERLLLEEITNTTQECKLYFTRSTAHLQNVKNFGHLTVSDSVFKLQDALKSLTVSIDSVSSQSASPKQIKVEREINTLLSEDSYNCWITAIAFLKNDNTVMVDRNNEKIKLFSKDCSCLDAVKLSNSKTTLFGIASSKRDEVAVTLTYKHRVQFITISGDALIPIEPETRCIETKQPCFGIASGYKQLFVCCAQLRSAPCCIKVFNDEEILLREIIFDKEGNSLFTSLSFSNIAFDPVRSLLYVVDQPIYRHSIVTFDLSGSLKSRDFMPYLRDNVCGVASIDTALLMALGNRTLCSLSDNGSEENVVTEIEVDTNFHCPCALAVNLTKDKIMVSQADPTFNYRSNNTVKLLSVQR